MKLMAVGGILAVLISVVYVARPVGFVPLFDGKLQRLAMTQAEAHCSAITWWESGEPEAAAECRENSALSTMINLHGVQPTFCAYVVPLIGGPMTQETCMEIMQSRQLWPTYDGGLTNTWSKSAPYPGTLLGGPVDEPTGRTGDRDRIQRP
jgi:hypothetical protein